MAAVSAGAFQICLFLLVFCQEFYGMHTRAMLGVPHIVQKDQLINWKAHDISEVTNCLSAMCNTNLHSCTGNDWSDSVLLLASNLSLGKTNRLKDSQSKFTNKTQMVRKIHLTI